MENSEDKRFLGYIVDQETRVDLLRNQAIAEVVVGLITSRGDGSVTIGVHGDWGAGKSSVLHMVEAAFEEGGRAAAEGNLCIRFNGWEFQGFEDAKIALIEGIVIQLVAGRTLTAEIKDAFKRAIGSIDWLKVAKRGGGLAIDLATGVPIMTIMSAQSALADPAALATRENIEAAAGEVTGVLKENRESPSVPKELREFRKAFEDLLSAAGIRRLVVLVDDLDRCLPETAIQTLEAIRLFVSLPKTAFVIGADEAMIEYAVRSHFKDMPEDAIRRGYPRAYLEKLIQVPFRIPALGEAETRIYVTMLLVGALITETSKEFDALLGRAKGRLSRPWERKALEDEDLKAAFGGAYPASVAQAAAMAAEISPVLAQGTNGNPRQIKRFVNALNLRLAVSEARGFGDVIDPAILAKLMLAELFLPESVFKHIGASVANSEDGWCPEVELLEILVRKPSAVPDGQEDAGTGADEEDSAFANDLVSEWATRPEMVRWARVEPTIGKEDLKPYLFVVNDRQNFVAGAKPMSPKLRALLTRLMAGGYSASGAFSEVKKLDGTEAEQLFSTMKSAFLTERSLNAAPPVVEALAILVRAHPGYEARYVELLEQLTPSSLGSWAGSRFGSVFTTASAKARFESLLARWAKEGSSVLKAALKMKPSDGKGS